MPGELFTRQCDSPACHGLFRIRFRSPARRLPTIGAFPVCSYRIAKRHREPSSSGSPDLGALTRTRRPLQGLVASLKSRVRRSRWKPQGVWRDNCDSDSYRRRAVTWLAGGSAGADDADRWKTSSTRTIARNPGRPPVATSRGAGGRGHPILIKSFILCVRGAEREKMRSPRGSSPVCCPVRVLTQRWAGPFPTCFVLPIGSVS